MSGSAIHFDHSLSQHLPWLKIAWKADYPQCSHVFQLKNSEYLHYLDQDAEDPSEAIVCLHGNPSWSWHFRSLFHAHKGKRIIAIDHLGMGLSCKVQRYVSVLEHANNVEALLLHLKIKKVHLVVHDWGGVIGLKALTSSFSIELISLIGMNTAFFPKTNFPFRIYASTLRLWRSLLNKNWGWFSNCAVYMTTNDLMSERVRRAYLYPYQNEQLRYGIDNFLSDIPWQSSHKNYSLLVELETKLQQLSIPMLALWGGRDFCFDESYLNHWKKLSPQLQMYLFKNFSHWSLEEAPAQLNQLMGVFWRGLK